MLSHLGGYLVSPEAFLELWDYFVGSWGPIGALLGSLGALLGRRLGTFKGVLKAGWAALRPS